MVLLIDANIILDVLLNRREFVKDSSMIWKLCETGKAKGYVSALTFCNLRRAAATGAFASGHSAEHNGHLY